MRYYYCVNCGNEEDLGKERQRGLKCSKCEYDGITGLSKEEYRENLAEKRKIAAWMAGELAEWTALEN